MRTEAALEAFRRGTGLRVLALASTLVCGAVSADLVIGQDPDTGLAFWTWSHQGVTLQLVQRLPDQTRAFFLGRGFPSAAADRIGRACVFQTIFRNDGTRPVDYDLDDWSIHSGGGGLPLRTRETWDRVWTVEGTGQAARIAFRWALLPTQQHFEPGDYNWGMTSFGLPPGEHFNLSLRIRIDGEPVAGEIPALVCAPDR